MFETFKVTPDTSKSEVDSAVSKAVAAVQAGQLVVIPTDTSYAVVCDAFNAGAITQLRIAKKQTSDIALPIAAGSIETIKGVANLSTLANDLASAFWPGALTLLTTAQDSLAWNVGGIGAALSVRVPNNEIAIKVLSQIGPCVMTGAQLAGQSSIHTVEQAISALGESVAIFLDAGELSQQSSSVIDTTGAHLRLVRAGSLTLQEIREIMPIVIDASATK